MSSREAFQPDWVSAPGDTIRDALHERGISYADFRRTLGVSSGEVGDLLSGVKPITIGLARRLNETIGGSVEFWMQRDHQYRTDSDRLAEETWLRQLPIRDMVRYGWVSAAEGRDLLGACLKFFGVDRVRDWSHTDNYLLGRAALRTSDSYPSEAAAVSAWLRRGDLEAASCEAGEWNPSKVERALADARALTRIGDPQRFLPALKERFCPHGLVVVAERAPAACRASGAAWFRSNGQGVVLLSFRYLSDDHLWFTFYHEAAHLLFHGAEKVFVDVPEDAQDEREKEANTYAATKLIPTDLRSELDRMSWSKRSLIRFAREAGISPGIAVGQLQHEGKLSMSRFNDLKRRYHWSESNLIKPGRA